MRKLDARLNRIEDEMNAHRRQDLLSELPLMLTIYADESVSDDAFDPETGRGPLVIVRPGERPVDKAISERDRPFIIDG